MTRFSPPVSCPGVDGNAFGGDGGDSLRFDARALLVAAGEQEDLRPPSSPGHDAPPRADA